MPRLHHLTRHRSHAQPTNVFSLPGALLPAFVRRMPGQVSETLAAARAWLPSVDASSTKDSVGWQGTSLTSTDQADGRAQCVGINNCLHTFRCMCGMNSECGTAILVEVPTLPKRLGRCIANRSPTQPCRHLLRDATAFLLLARPGFRYRYT